MKRYATSMAGRVFAALLLGVFGAFALSTLGAIWRVHHPYIILFFVAVLIALAALVARMTVRPLSVLAAAAAEVGKDVESSAPLAETGPAELREAAIAFNAMRARIRSDLQMRTYMLAAIAHDLQTPLTRLRLRLEKVDDPALRAKLVDDLAVMSETVREGLDLASSLDARVAPSRVDLDSLLESICADAQEGGHDVTFSGRTNSSVMAEPVALRRCVTNLVDNAVAYGKYARIEASVSGDRALIHVRDGGPGIPESDLENVRAPFVRLESSRSRETGGTGIGLTIADNVARRLGGTLDLRNHPDGGLEATVDLPQAKT